MIEEIKFRGNSKGVGLIEVLIALAILGIVAVAFLGGLATALHATFITDERSVAQSLATSQMEYVKNQGYSAGSWSYTVTTSGSSSPDGPSWFDPSHALPSNCDGYSVEVNATELDSELQKITVTVRHQGNEVLTLEDYKVNR